MAKKVVKKAKKNSEKRLEKKAEKDLNEAEKLDKKDQIAYQNRILKNIFVGTIIIVAAILAVMFFLRQTNNFTYRGVHFDITKTQSTSPYIILYQTSLPVVINGSNINYNFYLRNDPRKLQSEVPFIGSLNLQKNLVINGLGNFDCNGYATIAVANIVNLWDIQGIKVIRDPNATCDSQGRYTFIQVQNASNTSIVQTGPSCYDININNCQILKGMERFMTEDLVAINKMYTNQSS